MFDNVFTTLRIDKLKTGAYASRSLRVPRASLMYFTALILVGAVLVLAFESGYLLPTPVSVALMFALTLWGLWQARLSPLSPLTRLMILLYFMPFSVCWGYLFDPNYTWWYTPLSLDYMSDPVITAGMVMVGLIGLVGLLAGIWLARMLAPRRLTTSPAASAPARTLHPFTFGALLITALFFSYINTPSATILTAAYSSASGLAGQLNFNAAFLVAYTLLIALFIDAEQEVKRWRLRLLKRLGILAVTVFILIFFQLLRGDRDSFGLVVGLGALYLTEPLRRTHWAALGVRLRRYLLIGTAGGVVLVAFLAISTLRTRVVGGEQVPLGTAIVEGYKESTWSAVLLTNLSLAAQYHQGRMVTEGGRTYLDYLYSLPPGFVTRALGIERPIEPYQGPNFWFTDISSGGLHVVTVPFKNFHSPGVLIVLILFGYIIGRSEIIGQSSRWLNRLWYGSLFVGSAQWFWYGDITFIREVMIFGLVAVLYATTRRVAGLRPVQPSAKKGGIRADGLPQEM
jgi:hypothetical protein